MMSGTNSVIIARGFGAGVMVLMLAGCFGADRLGDLREFMQAVQQQPGDAIAPLPDFAAYRPFAYGAAQARSPFQRPAARPGAGVRPPRQHTRQPLESFPLSALSMVGTMQKQDAVFALIEDAQGAVHRVQVGDYMGEQWGRVDSIEDSRMVVTETVSDGAGGWLRRRKTIELKGSGQGG